MENRIPLQVGVTQTGYQDEVAKNIHQTILSIDTELTKTVDNSYRQLLVKTNYMLRDLEERIQRFSESP
jgi:hypothetical protein